MCGNLPKLEDYTHNQVQNCLVGLAADDDMDLEEPAGVEGSNANKRSKGAETRKVPLGVTLIGDDEDEVQLGMQKAVRQPRSVPGQAGRSNYSQN